MQTFDNSTLRRSKSCAKSFGFIDVHCHLGEERILSNLDKEISDAKEVGISRFISNALCQEEFELMNSKQISEFQDIILWTAGIHPYYNKSSEDDIESLIEHCDAKEIIAIGEIGLDNHNDNFEWQKKILLMQLDLAKNYDLPVVFHDQANNVCRPDAVVRTGLLSAKRPREQGDS